MPSEFYFKPFDAALEDKYDFVRPGAYDWGEIFNLLYCLINNEKTIPTLKKEKYTNDGHNLIYNEGPFPRDVISEGIYSFN